MIVRIKTCQFKGAVMQIEKALTNDSLRVFVVFLRVFTCDYRRAKLLRIILRKVSREKIVK